MYIVFLFRDDTAEMMGVMKDENVPCLILSAGLGDLILEILKHFKVNHDNVKVR